MTFTAGAEKIFHPDPRIGFLAQARALNDKLPALQTAVETAQTSGDTSAIAAAAKAVHDNRAQHLNDLIDTGVTAAFLIMVSAIVLISIWEWLLLLARKRLAMLHENEPVWLPEYAVAEGRQVPVMGLVAALTFALLLAPRGNFPGRPTWNERKNRKPVRAAMPTETRPILEDLC